MTQRLTYSEARNISIVDYLAGLGLKPTKVRGSDHWYHSPFREERTPSFKVNARLNLWYDFGIGEGGTLIDLGKKLYGDEQVFMEKLSQGNFLSPERFNVVDRNQRENRIEILSVENLTSPTLKDYLLKRGIDSKTAERFCKEVEFRIA